MIKKFCGLKNVGKFASLKAAGDVELRPLTLMFGENGRGKTTLCCVLRSLTTGDCFYFSERHTLGETSPPEATILTDVGLFEYKNGAWTGTLPDIAVFDCMFVHENVCAGERVDHEHKKNLHRVIVGKQGVELNQRVIDLDSASRSLAGELRTAKAEVEKFIPSGISLSTFLGLAENKTADAEMLAIESDIASLKRANDIKTKGKLSLVTLPEFPATFEQLLAKELTDVSADAEKELRDHLSSHTNGASEEWIGKGLSTQRDTTCPFCGLDTGNLPLVKAYKAYFSESYKTLKREIAAAIADLKNSFGSTAVLAIEQVFSKNDSLRDFWSPFIDLAPAGPLEKLEFKSAFETLGEAATVYAIKKANAPLEKVVPASDLFTAKEDYAKVTQALERYNTAVIAANELIQACKDRTKGGDLAERQKSLVLLQAAKARHTPEAAGKCKVYDAALQLKSKKEGEKETAKQQLDAYSAAIFTTYKDRINELLADFNTSFRLGDITPQYTGGQPSSSYDVVIKNHRVAIGVTDAPRGDRCFSSTLSAGDRSTLALAFFLAQLEQDPNYAQTVVVFDDPFTSQDRFRRTRTQQLICDKALACKQVIVLSHDAQFLKLVWDNHSSASIKTLQLTRVGRDDATITEWDIVEATKSGYAQDYTALMAYLHQNAGTPKDIARTIRPILEGYLRVRFPADFPPGKWLGQLIDQIRDAQAGSTLAALHGQSLDDLTSINGFSKTFHHETNPTGFDSAVPNEDELVAFGQKTIRFVGGF